MTNPERAKELLKEGQDLIVQGNLDAALECFKESVNEFPTAEGYTYWAWMQSYEGDLESCIELCKKAIDLDPEFGNAYNDIGSYLIELNRLEDAIPWLKKAQSAQNCDARHFPFLNLGRIYLKLDRDAESLEEYKELLKIDQNNVEAKFLTEYLDDSDKPDRFLHLFSQN